MWKLKRIKRATVRAKVPYEALSLTKLIACICEAESRCGSPPCALLPTLPARDVMALPGTRPSPHRLV